jgi:hypothetical protein
VPGRGPWRSLAEYKGLDLHRAVKRISVHTSRERTNSDLDNVCEVEVEEREAKGPWIKSLIKKGSFSLISGGAPYYCRWRTISREPFEYMLVGLELPLLQRALQESFGADVHQVRLRDLSGFEDAVLSSLMEQLYDELMRRRASHLRVEGLAQVIAVHLAQNYSEAIKEHGAGPSLPPYKLRQITDWIAEHAFEDFNLVHLADLAGLSKFHFHRLFKVATLQYIFRALGLEDFKPSPQTITFTIWTSTTLPSTTVTRLYCPSPLS